MGVRGRIEPFSARFLTWILAIPEHNQIGDSFKTASGDAEYRAVSGHLRLQSDALKFLRKQENCEIALFYLPTKSQFVTNSGESRRPMTIENK